MKISADSFCCSGFGTLENGPNTLLMSFFWKCEHHLLWAIFNFTDYMIISHSPFHVCFLFLFLDCDFILGNIRSVSESIESAPGSLCFSKKSSKVMIKKSV